jgi:hypothetical protein
LLSERHAGSPATRWHGQSRLPRWWIMPIGIAARTAAGPMSRNLTRSTRPL